MAARSWRRQRETESARERRREGDGVCERETARREGDGDMEKETAKARGREGYGEEVEGEREEGMESEHENVRGQ